MDLFLNLCFVQCFDVLVDFLLLKKDVVVGLDIMIVCELMLGVYFGELCGIFIEGNECVGINIQCYIESEIVCVVWLVFELVKCCGNKVCLMEKVNVMELGILWCEVVQKVYDEEYFDVELSYMYVDVGVMQLCCWFKQFDVIVIDNLFGDLLLDVVVMLIGLLGMLLLVLFGLLMVNGCFKVFYELVYGLVFDIVGQNKVNLIVCILLFVMVLCYLFDFGVEVDCLEGVVEKVLVDGVCIVDLFGEEGVIFVLIIEMGDKIVEVLNVSL